MSNNNTNGDESGPYSMRQYIPDACRTKSGGQHPKTLPAIAADENRGDMFHAAIGMVTEAGEIMDAWKKHIFYGKELDLVNLDEEMGDLLWYLAVYLNARGKTFEGVAEVNIAKLRARFPNKFTTENALNRDLDTERKILEKGCNPI